MRIGSLWQTNARLYSMKQLFWSDGPIKILGVFIHAQVEVLLEENYSSIVDKIKNILAARKNKALSPIGKIMVINSMISSQCIYQFSALYSPSVQFFKEIKKMVTEFIWDRKPSKIKYAKLVLDLARGGLNLSDLTTKNDALKAAWVKRAMDMPVKGFTIYYNLPWKNQLIWLSNISKHRVTIPCKWSFVALLMKSGAFQWKALRFSWKAPEKLQKPLIQHRSLIFDLVFHRVQREGQLGRSYILMVFGGAHACLVVHICVYGACMHTYVWSFVLYNFIMDFIKCNTILLKPKWFHFMRFQTTSWNPTGFYRVTGFHKIHRSLQDYIKSRSISWNLRGFH